MSRFHFSSRRKLYSASLVSLVCAAALVMSGCISITHGPYHYTAAIWQGPSNQIVWAWAGPSCNQDVDGNGTKGSPHDRALCAFYLIRGNVCNAVKGEAQSICNVATEANGRTIDGTLLWQEFNAAAGIKAQRGDCLAITYGVFGNIKDWVVLNLGQEGCRK